MSEYVQRVQPYDAATFPLDLNRGMAANRLAGDYLAKPGKHGLATVVSIVTTSVRTARGKTELAATITYAAP